MIDRRKKSRLWLGKLFATKPRCPHCKHTSFHRSSRIDWIENLLSIVGIYPFRCENYRCNRRFLMFSRR